MLNADMLHQSLTHRGAQVSEAAARALRHVSFYGGLGGTLRSLIASQSDYVIDALCMRLRHLEVSLVAHAVKCKL